MRPLALEPDEEPDGNGEKERSRDLEHGAREAYHRDPERVVEWIFSRRWSPRSDRCARYRGRGRGTNAAAAGEARGGTLMGSVPTLAIEVATGIALASCAGLRAFLPLFVTGALGRLGWISLSPSFEWLSSWPALVIFGVAVGTEMLGDKIPIVDHLLDV